MSEKKNNLWEIAGIASEFGYLIALPLVGCALAGRFVDRVVGSSPLFFLVGILTAIILTTLLVYRKTMSLLKKAEKDNNEKQ